MKRLLLVLSAFALVLGSCSKSEDTPVVVDDSGLVENLDNILIKQIIESNGTTVTNTTTFTYDGKKIVKTEDTQGKKVVFIYVGSQISKKESYLNNTLTDVQKFEYNTDLKLIKYSELNSNLAVQYYENYSYNADYTIITYKNYNTNYSEGNSFDGTMTKLERPVTEKFYHLDFNSLPSYTIDNRLTYTFDAKNSFYKNITNYKSIAFAGNKNLNTGVNNNITKLIKYRKNNDTNDISNIVTNWVYTYKSNDFPATCVKTVNNNGTTSTTNITYVY